MVILETSVFSRRLEERLSDEEYRKLQLHLVVRPDAGTIMVGSGGIRKIRWRTQDQGKSGGVRVIYYWAVSQDKLLMLSIYAKNEQANLTREQVRTLRAIVEEEYP